jgi:hypothetical protein
MTTDLTAASEASSIHKLAVETDTKLAALYERRAVVQSHQDSARHTIRSLAGQTHSVRTGWSGTVQEALAFDPAGLMAWDARSFRDARDRFLAAADEIVTIDAEIRPLDLVWVTYRWDRFFLVKNTNGHIHADMGCHTCHYDTRFAWLPELSGLTEAEAVEAYGEILCSVCFPSAPVAWTQGVSKAVQAERDARAQAKAERAAKKAEKALFPEDPERFIKTRYDNLKTLAAAKMWLTDADERNYGFPEDVLQDPSRSCPLEKVTEVAEALAARLGTTVTEVLSDAHKRAQKRSR